MTRRIRFGGAWDEIRSGNYGNAVKWASRNFSTYVYASMLSIREKLFLTRLQEKYRKKSFAFLNAGKTQTITMDGQPLNLEWFPALAQLSDSCGAVTEVLFEDCITAIKEKLAVEKQRKRQAKKVYLEQNK